MARKGLKQAVSSPPSVEEGAKVARTAAKKSKRAGKKATEAAKRHRQQCSGRKAGCSSQGCDRSRGAGRGGHDGSFVVGTCVSGGPVCSSPWVVTERGTGCWKAREAVAITHVFSTRKADFRQTVQLWRNCAGTTAF